MNEVLQNMLTRRSIRSFKEEQIKNEELDLFCILDHGTISITNHVYHYDVVVNDRNWERLSKMYDGKVETIRQE